jgi:predicted dehydrogenase
MSLRASRRTFLQSSAAVVASSYFINPAPAQESKSTLEKLNLAAIGAANRAGANISGCSSENFLAIADVDANLLDKGAAAFPNAHKFRDFRTLLEKFGDKLDAVLVGTADHTHAPAAAMALRMNKHVYCEKPLTHTVFEARTLANLAKEKKLVTQMGTQIHAENNYRRVVELIQAKAIGEVKEVHVWVGANYSGAKFDHSEPCPTNLDWDLWLGPAPQREYSKGVHPFNWRRFWDYGNGAFGDMACHYMDLPFWALNLRAPLTISAEGSQPVDAVSCPSWVICQYEFPARDALPPVKLTWYDGGKKPELLGTLKDKEGKPLNWGGGQLFVGSEGMLLSDYGRHVLLPVEKFVDFKAPEPTIPNSIGHHKEWLQAIRTGGPTTCNFDYSGALTEAVLLGTVAYRAGGKLEWDAANLKVTNSPAAHNLIHKEYRKGWVL